MKANHLDLLVINFVGGNMAKIFDINKKDELPEDFQNEEWLQWIINLMKSDQVQIRPDRILIIWQDKNGETQLLHKKITKQMVKDIVGMLANKYL